MSRRKKVYEGKAKMLYEGPEPGTLVQYFKDDASTDGGAKETVIAGKGVLNNRISEYIMSRLNEIGIPTHFMRRLNMREQLVKEVEIIPLELIVRNVAAGTFATRLGIAEGTTLPRSIIEYRYKGGEKGKQLVSEEHITAFGWASPQDIDDMMSLALRTNDFLNGLFFGIGIRLIDFRLEFGRLFLEEEVLLIIADEISPDNCRLWDSKTDERLDKDRFRCDLGNIQAGYQEVARRLGIFPESGGPGDHKGPKVMQ